MRGSVVIPAHNESPVITRCLDALRRSASATELEVVVVANGCSDDTVAIASAYQGLPGLIVVDTPVPSKVAALNLGDTHATSYPRVYLDADIELSPRALDDLLTSLDRPEPRVASPRVAFDCSCSTGPVRAFYRAYEETPYIKDGLIGLGVYAMNQAGRERFDAFPDLVADDLFVQLQFAPEERLVLESTFTVQVPRTTRHLLKVRTRTARGNAELDEGVSAQAIAAPGGASTLRSLVRACIDQPTLAPAAATYVALTVASRANARRRGGPAWHRDDSSRAVAPAPAAGPPIVYLVSEYPAPSHVFIEREVEAVRRQGIDVRTMSVRPTAPSRLLDDHMRREAANTTALLADRGTVVRAVASLALRRPNATTRAVVRSQAVGDGSLRNRVWQLFYLAEAVLLLTSMRAVGARHVHVHFANNAADIARAAVSLGNDIDRQQTWTWSFTMHGPTEFENVVSYDLAAKARSASAVACITDFARSQLMRVLPPAEWPKLHRVPMSVDVDRFAPVERDGREGHAFRILFVGRLVPEKGPGVLLDAIATLVAQGAPVEVRIAGGGPLQRDLESQSRALDLQHCVTFVGAVPQSEVLELCEWADVFCLPSFQEGLPVVLMEALATELAVLTTAIAGIPELVIDGETGLLVTPGRPDALAAALASLASDRSTARRLGRSGRLRVERAHSTEIAGRLQAEFLRSAASL